MSVVPQASALAEQQRFAVVDHLAIDAHPADLAGEAAMLDLGAAVHHHGEAAIRADLLGFLTDHAQLHPQHLDAQTVSFRYDLARDIGRVFGFTEDIHHV